VAERQRRPDRHTLDRALQLQPARVVHPPAHGLVNHVVVARGQDPDM
jgi:hypothetical protein